MKKNIMISKENSEMTPEFKDKAISLIAEFENSNDQSLKNKTDFLSLPTGKLVIHPLKDSLNTYLMDVELPIGNFPLIIDDENDELAVLRIKANTKIAKWRKCKGSSVYISYGQCPNKLTTNIRKESKLFEIGCMMFLDIETYFLTRLRLDLLANPDLWNLGYNEKQILKNEGTLDMDDKHNNCAIIFSENEGLLYSFVGYDDSDEAVCVVFYFLEFVNSKKFRN